MPDREPSDASAPTFLGFYLRGWFWLAIPGVPLLLALRNGEAPWEAILFGCLLGAAVSLISAAVLYRRVRRAVAYRPPATHAVVDSGPLPRTVVTTSDLLERRRGLAIAWWVIVLVSGAAIAWGFVALSSGELAAMGASETVLAVVLGVVAVVWLLVAIAGLWSVGPLVRNARLAAERPDALVLTAYFGFDGISAGQTLRAARDLASSWWSARVGMLTTLVVDREGIEFWVSRGEPRYRIPWADLGTIEPSFVDVDTGGGSSPSLGLVVSLRVREGGESVGWLDLEFLVGRSDAWISFPIRDRGVIESVAAAVAARRPDASDVYRGFSLGEMEQILDALAEDGDHDGVEELLGGLQEWLAARGGRAPRGGEWLPERLARRAQRDSAGLPSSGDLPGSAP